MNEQTYPMPIKEYARLFRTQEAAAKSLGVARPTLTLWLIHSRKIFAMPHKNGQMGYYEIKESKERAA